jgi:hypothetical protein
MNNFDIEIWDDEGLKCTFYTVRLEDEELSETDKFFDKYDNIDIYKSSIQELSAFILITIGDDHGAEDALLNRAENEVIGLPVKRNVRLKKIQYYFPEFPLRLYAMKIRDNIMVLFNGGVKDGAKNQTSSLSMSWRSACQYAKKIDEAIIDKTIMIDENNRKLLFYDGSDKIIL